jgi:hypothetical protein
VRNGIFEDPRVREEYLKMVEQWHQQERARWGRNRIEKGRVEVPGEVGGHFPKRYERLVID